MKARKNNGGMKVFSGNGNMALAADIAKVRQGGGEGGMGGREG